MEVNKTNIPTFYKHGIMKKKLTGKIHLSSGYGEIYEKSTQRSEAVSSL